LLSSLALFLICLLGAGRAWISLRKWILPKFCLLLTLGFPIYFSLAAESQPSFPFRQNFYDVKFYGDRAWIVGYYGTILHSPDRLVSWQVQEGGTHKALFRVDFVDGMTGWISGAQGEILHTKNGGKTWVTQKSGTTEPLLGMEFVDSRSGWIVGARGTILSTQDGGQTWLDRSLKTDVILNDVQFITPDDGWIVGELGVIYRTQDGGKNWKKQKSPVEVDMLSGVSSNLFRVLILDAQTRFAFGLDGGILNGSNGEWKVVHNMNNPTNAATRHHLFDAAVMNGRIWAVGERGAVWASDKPSLEWRRINIGAPPLSLNGIAFNPDGTGLIVGDRGLLFRTVDQGRSWRAMSLAEKK